MGKQLMMNSTARGFQVLDGIEILKLGIQAIAIARTARRR
jgi:hypothetical protein